MSYLFLGAAPGNYLRLDPGRKVDVLVVHTIESDEKGDSAESCARWFQNPSAKVSAHYCVDNNSVVQSVREQDVAYTAPGANHDGIHIEHAGRARQTPAEWDDPYSKAMLNLSVRLAADVCKRHGIPARWLTAEAVRAGQRGITSHANVSKAFGKSTHTDPGVGFPYRAYVARVKALMAAPARPPKKILRPTVSTDFWRIDIDAGDVRLRDQDPANPAVVSRLGRLKTRFKTVNVLWKRK